jgi:hypothetical protein
MKRQIPTQTYVVCVMYERGLIIAKEFEERREFTLPPDNFLAEVGVIMTSGGKVLVSLSSYPKPTSEGKPDDRGMKDLHFDNIRFSWVTGVHVRVKWDQVELPAAEDSHK